MTTIIEIQERDGLKVMMNNQITLICRYQDENGDWYFLNENLEKQFIKDTPIYVGPLEDVVNEANEDEVEEPKEYCFEVEYRHDGRVRGWAFKETRVVANSYNEAIEKVYGKFKEIYEISEL